MSHSIITLDNGLRVVLLPRSEGGAVSVTAMVGVGSRHETAAISGIAHFIEHMGFKGSLDWPGPGDVAYALDAVGADYNAATSRDWTAYYTKVSQQHLPLALSIVSNLVFFPLDETERVMSERGVITQELHMYQDNPLMYVEQVVDSVAFGNHPLGWDIGGTPQTVQAMTRAKLQRFRQQHYQPRNVVIAIAGPLPKNIRSLVKQALSGATADRQKISPPKRFSSSQRQPRQQIIRKATDQVQLGLAWPSVGRGHRDVAVTQLIATMLGGNMSSRLFLNVRDAQGLAYYITARNNFYAETGTFYIQAGVGVDQWQQAVRAIHHEIEQFVEQGCGPDELTRAKEFLTGKITLDMEDTVNQANWYARQLVLKGQIETPQQRIAALRAVTPAQVRRVAKRLFTAAQQNAAVIGPIKSSVTIPVLFSA